MKIRQAEPLARDLELRATEIESAHLIATLLGRGQEVAGAAPDVEESPAGLRPVTQEAPLIPIQGLDRKSVV